MRTVPMRQLTIVAEAVLEERLLAELRAAGAHGWTIGEVRGEGSSEVRASEWQGPNVRIETLVGEAVAQRLLDRLATAYFPHYSLIAYLATVEVIRGEKYD